MELIDHALYFPCLITHVLANESNFFNKKIVLAKIYKKYMNMKKYFYNKKF
jgi:hypothetical protein